MLGWAGWKTWSDLNTDNATRQFRTTLQQLEDSDASERWRAAGNLTVASGRSDIESAVVALVRASKDKDIQVRTIAARALGTLVSRVAGPRDDGVDLPHELVDKWVDEATRSLVNGISDPDDAGRVAAIQGLAMLSAQPNAAASGGAMQGRAPVIGGGAIVKKPGFQPPPGLVESLNDGETRWDRASAQAFYGYVDSAPPPELLAALKDQSLEVRIAAVKALVNYPLNLDSAIPLLLAMLDRNEPELQEVCTAALRLAWPTTAVLPSLTESLKRGTDRIIPLAALLLGRIGPDASDAVPDLLVIVKQPLNPATPRPARGRVQEDAPCLAARALGSISSSDEVIAALTEILKSDVDYRHGAAADGLAEIGDPARVAAPALVAAYSKWLRSNDRLNTGQLMTTALGRLAPKTPVDKDAVRLLIQALELKDRSIPTEAAKALAKFGKSAAAAIPKLRIIKEHGPSAVSAAAEATLEAIDGTTKPKVSESEKG